MLDHDTDTAREITQKAKARYKEILAGLPEFDPDDRFQLNIAGCAMLCAFILSMPRRPEAGELTDCCAKAMTTAPMRWFCRQSGKTKLTPKDAARMKAAAALKAAHRSPYSWNMEFIEYPDGSGCEGRFTRCGICTLMQELGLFGLTPAMCHPGYTMSEAGGRIGILWGVSCGTFVLTDVPADIETARPTPAWRAIGPFKTPGTGSCRRPARMLRGQKTAGPACGFFKCLCPALPGKTCAFDHAMNALNRDIRAFFDAAGTAYPVWRGR